MKTQLPTTLISLACLFAGVASVPASAQDGGRPNPGVFRSRTDAARPDSAFSDYKPFREQPVRSWKDANQEVADNPGMGSMADMPGMNMPGMDSKGGAAANGKSGGAMPGMGAMLGMKMPGMDSKGSAAASGKSGGAMPGMNMPGMGSKTTADSKGKASGAMAGMGAMPGMGAKNPRGTAGATDQGSPKPGMGGMGGMAMPGMSQQASKMNMAGAQHEDAHEGNAKAGGAMPGMSMKDDHLPQGKTGAMPGMAMPGMEKSGDPEMTRLTGTGVVRDVDKAGGRIRLTHDPIAAVNWPQMTIVFRVKNASLVDQVKQGDKVEFVLSRSSTGFLISDIQNTAKRGPNQTR